MDAVDFLGRQFEDLARSPTTRWCVDELLRDDVDAEARAVDGDRLAVAVDDPAAARRDGDQLDAVALGQQLVMFVLADREIAEPANQQPAKRRLGAADQQHPP